MNNDEFRALDECVAMLHNEVSSLAGSLTGRLPNGVPVPPDLAAWIDVVWKVRQKLDALRPTYPQSYSIPESDRAIARTAVAAARRQRAKHAEEQASYFASPVVREKVRSYTAVLDRLLADELCDVVPLRRPRLGDYLTV